MLIAVEIRNASEHQLSESKIEEIRKDFSFFDRDGNGQIDLPEFIELLTVISPKTKASRTRFKLIDSNDDGYIDFEEFWSGGKKDGGNTKFKLSNTYRRLRLSTR